MNSPRPLVVVLGSGRSGTSLLMQALAGLGMAVSEQLIAARPDNPEGFYEDAALVRRQADLMRSLGAWPFHPLPTDWLDHPATREAARDLGALLDDRLARATGLWGFKDPRTAPFLPLWQELFAARNLAPRYLLALRQPDSVIRSFMAAYGVDAGTAEAVWLRRTWEALWHTRADCHVVHYEDWFRRGSRVIEDLARHCDLAVADPERVLAGLIRPDLNRSGHGGPRLPGGDGLGSPAARRLLAALATCRGGDFARADLLAVLHACRPEP
ncbi:MAG: sulfotransferase [Pseudomonadota bacterium]